MNIEKEEWKYVEYKNTKTNRYMVSNFGNIRNNKSGRTLNPWTGKNGYLYTSLMQKDNTVLKVAMHVLVATHFIPIPEELSKLNEPLVPNHDDFDKTNNHYTNLTWMTYAMNNQWNREFEHWKVCENAPNAKVSNELVHKICKLMEDGYLNKEIKEKLSLSNDKYYSALLTLIRTGSEWKEISKNYNIINKNTLRKNDDAYVDKICQLIEKNCTVKDMRKIMNIPDTNDDKDRFKKLVWFIRNRKSYKDISENYTWWK